MQVDFADKPNLSRYASDLVCIAWEAVAFTDADRRACQVRFRRERLQGKQSFFGGEVRQRPFGNFFIEILLVDKAVAKDYLLRRLVDLQFDLTQAVFNPFQTVIQSLPI